MAPLCGRDGSGLDGTGLAGSVITVKLKTPGNLPLLSGAARSQLSLTPSLMGIFASLYPENRTFFPKLSILDQTSLLCIHQKPFLTSSSSQYVFHFNFAISSIKTSEFVTIPKCTHIGDRRGVLTLRKRRSNPRPG
jgi:hypothetical protein